MSPYMVLPLVTGAITAIPAYIVFRLLHFDHPFLWTVIAACGFMLILYPILRISGHRPNQKYAAFEAAFKAPFFHRMNANIKFGSSLRNGNLYFCDSCIVLASLDEKPTLIEELPLEQIERFTFDDIHMEIHVRDGRIFRLTSSEIEETRKALKARKWVY